MLEIDTIQVLGRGANVDFTIDDTVPFETAARNLREYLSECRGLYSKGTISVNVGRRILVAEQLSGIKRILDKESGLTVSRYWCAPETLEDALAQNEGEATLTHSPGEVALPEAVPSGIDAPVEAVELPEPEPTAATAEVIPVEPIWPEPRPDAGAVEGEQLAQAISRPEKYVYDLPQNEEVENYESENRRTDGTRQSHLVEVPPELVAVSFEADAAGEAAPEDAAPEGAEQALAETGPEGSDIVSLASASLAENLDSGEVIASGHATADITGEEPEPVQSESLPTEASPLPYPVGGDWPSQLRRGSEALIIKTTCRSGEVIRYPGDVVVLADVNPGAEVIAGGDIVVLGALRGTAHAGADGDLKSIIIAMNLESYRLQIGQHIGEAPRKARRAKSQQQPAAPRIAYLRRNSIFVAPFVRRYEEYQGGILYEG